MLLLCVQLLWQIKGVSSYTHRGKKQEQIVSYVRARRRSSHGKTATVSTSAAIVTARLVAFVSGAGIADLAPFSRSSQPPFPGWQDFTLCLHQATPRRQVVINSRRNNRTAEGTSKMANTETARRLFQANDCLFFDAAKNAKNVRNAPTPLFFFIIFATFAIEGKRMERGIGLDESF